jgi:hypothetical protein
MDPTQTAALLQGATGGAQTGSPQALATIQSLMRGAPGGLGAMQPPPNPLQPPPGVQSPTQPMPQQQSQPQNVSPGGVMQPALNQQALMQLLNAQPQPVSP